MECLFLEQKLVFIGVKVMLNFIVFCKIILCNDDGMVDVDEIFFFFDIVFMYMFKNLFFYCIEENVKNIIGRIVIIGQIFSKLFQLLIGLVLVWYFFVFG